MNLLCDIIIWSKMFCFNNIGRSLFFMKMKIYDLNLIFNCIFIGGILE